MSNTILKHDCDARDAVSLLTIYHRKVNQSLLIDKSINVHVTSFNAMSLSFLFKDLALAVFLLPFGRPLPVIGVTSVSTLSFSGRLKLYKESGKCDERSDYLGDVQIHFSLVVHLLR